MKLTMLGTGNASVKDCYNTCFVLSEGNQHFLIDAGGGNQVLKRLDEVKIRLKDIHDIFITHEHIDHILGVFWLIRMIGQQMHQGKYAGELRIYCHEELNTTIRTIAQLTIQDKVLKLLDDRIQLIVVRIGDTKEILGCPVTFFDIGSTKAKQYGFTITTEKGKKITCCGDEPYQECEREYALGSDWLLHEAFCLFAERDLFKPYEKHHTTVKEACMIAEELKIPNLILYHTEEVNLQERKRLYIEEGRRYYSGNLWVPDDGEVFEL